ncbi:MAG: hypothetical protein M3458_20875 [Acidobacteriota bacterium]|nr:hypothetical protein [Acidobacteriota bacterium]
MTDKDASTRPTLDTILERLSDMRDEMRRGFSALNVRLDRVEGLASTTRGEMLTLRADFIELRDELHEHFPVLRS